MGLVSVHFQKYWQTYVVSSGSSGGSLSGVSALLADSAPDRGVVEFRPPASAPSIKQSLFTYNVKNGSSIITSKSWSKNLSNENKRTLCFQRIGILIHVLS